MLQRRKQRPLSVADLVEHDERVPVVGALLALEHSLCDRGIARAVTRGSSPGWERAGERVNRRPRARKAGEVGSDARALAYLTRSETRSERWKKHARDQPRLCRVLPASKHTNLKQKEICRKRANLARIVKPCGLHGLFIMRFYIFVARSNLLLDQGADGSHSNCTASIFAVTTASILATQRYNRYI